MNLAKDMKVLTAKAFYQERSKKQPTTCYVRVVFLSSPAKTQENTL